MANSTFDTGEEYESDYQIERTFWRLVATLPGAAASLALATRALLGTSRQPRTGARHVKSALTGMVILALTAALASAATLGTPDLGV